MHLINFKEGDYINALVCLGQARWAANPYWQITKIAQSALGNDFSVWLENPFNRTEVLEDWPLYLITVHEVYNKESMDILYGTKSKNA